MLTVQEWFSRCQGADRPWLLLGKGPSFSKLREYDQGPFLTFGLNHVVRERPVTASHIIDYDVFEQCAERILGHAKFLLMPLRPHVRNRPGPVTLQDYVRRHPVLRQLEAGGRLVGYHLSTSGRRSADGSPVIQVKYFSAEAALRILTLCGARVVRSLGIDGGADYADEFGDLRSSTLLSNHRASFNEQFAEIASIIRVTDVDYAPLDVPSPLRVYVGTTASQELACQVLAYSIRRHTSMTTEVVPMRDMRLPLPKSAQNRPRTPFSFSRFLIPELAGYRGQALYLDADMLVFADLLRLWRIPLNGHDLLYVQQPDDARRQDQYSVLLLNCENLRWDIEEIVRGLDDGALAYEGLMQEFCLVPRERMAAGIPWVWNCLERYVPGKTALLHYTDMPRQPWVSATNRWGCLWVAELMRAVHEGVIALETVEEQVRRGYARPSLLAQVKVGMSRCGWCFAGMDWRFDPPYRALLPQRLGFLRTWRECLSRLTAPQNR